MVHLYAASGRGAVSERVSVFSSLSVISHSGLRSSVRKNPLFLFFFFFSFLPWPLTEAAVEMGQMGGVGTQLGAQMRVDRLGGDCFSEMTGDIIGVFVVYTDENMCDPPFT